jgi:hypothetical protein
MSWHANIRGILECVISLFIFCIFKFFKCHLQRAKFRIASSRRMEK